jgi:adenylosuccinate lyase
MATIAPILTAIATNRIMCIFFISISKVGQFSQNASNNKQTNYKFEGDFHHTHLRNNPMSLNPLTAISPVDGRYHSKTKSLTKYFSEYGLMYYRVLVEIEYIISLSQSGITGLNLFSERQQKTLCNIYLNFTEADALQIKEIEKTTNHDVKAVEYFIKAQIEKSGIEFNKEFIHFGLTSQDINNTAIPLSLKEADKNFLLPELKSLVSSLTTIASEWKTVPLLARTHGQPASPTTLGKEIYVFAERLQNQISMLEAVPYGAKFGGATGNFNAHHVAFPDKDWIAFANDFVNNKLGLSRMQFTTQIEHYDYLAARFDTMKRINTILIDFCRDVWTYISMDYFKQKTKEGEIGSSAMPHKVNPIDFENAEGNLGIANALLAHLSAKLPISRLQRDLTDSTVLRNVGVPYAHIAISLESIKKGIGKLVLNQSKIESDLEANWAVVAEAVQTILRANNIPNPYEKLKELTRGKEINEISIRAFIDGLDVSEDIKVKLRAITPQNYVGVCGKF